MFKLESYITPLILSRVEKYVKNVRTEDSQVSLWGGDVSLTNLDLRLDVLEEEFRLPFRLVSGHIHELQIHVPWTRLQSEPIVLTINTIECVLKLPDSGEDDARSGSVSSGSITSQDSARKARRSRGGEEAAAAGSPPGYVQNLVNKILSNVQIVCNNLILKYVEDDLVLSINVRHASLVSVDGNWEPAFTELSAPELTLRKLLSVSDLTVCLDRRGPLGKIQVYEDPILYRCYLSVRISWLYRSLFNKTAFRTLFHLHADKLEFSITNKQIVPLYRLYQMLLVISSRPNVPQEGGGLDGEDDKNSEDKENNDQLDDGDSYTLGGILWTVGSTVGSALLPVTWDDEDDQEYQYEQQQMTNQQNLTEDISTSIAFAIKDIAFTLKTSRSVKSKGLYGGLRNIVNPFMCVTMQGLALRLSSLGHDWVNVQGGITQIICTKTDQDNEKCGSVQHPYLLIGCESDNYLKDSLFEPNASLDEEKRINRVETNYNKVKNWDLHMERESESALLERHSALAVDYLYQAEYPTDATPEDIIKLNTNMEHSNIPERAQGRVVIGPANVYVDHNFMQKINILQDAMLEIDASGTGNQIETPKLEIPSKEEIDNLENNNPFKVFSLTFLHPTINVAVNGKTSLECGLRNLVITQRSPMYPLRNVKVGSMMHPPSPILLNNCHSSITLIATESWARLQQESNQCFQLAAVEKFRIVQRTLLFQDYWKNIYQKQGEINIDVDQIESWISANAIQNLRSLYKSFVARKTPTPGLSDYESNVTDGQIINMSATKLSSAFTWTSKMNTIGLSIGPTQLRYTVVPPGSSHKPKYFVFFKGHPSVAKHADSYGVNGSDWLHCVLQYPASEDLQFVPPIVYFRLSRTELLLFTSAVPILLDLSKGFDIATDEASIQKVDDSGFKSANESFDQRSESKAPETRTSTANLGESNPSVARKSIVKEIYTDLIRSAIVNVKMDRFNIFIVESLNFTFASESVTESLNKITSLKPWLGILRVGLPLIQCTNSNVQVTVDSLAQFPILFPPTIWIAGKNTLPLALNMDGFEIDILENKPLLMPVSFRCTLSLNRLQKNSSASFVLHTDFSTVEICLDEEQVPRLLGTLDTLINIYGQMAADASMANEEPEMIYVKSSTASQNIVHHSVSSVSEYGGISVTVSQDTQDMRSERLGNNMVSIWLQFTIPNLTYRIIGRTGFTVPKRLSICMEDTSISLDSQAAYTKISLRMRKMSSLSEEKGANDEWTESSQMLIVSCNRDLYPDLHTWIAGSGTQERSDDGSDSLGGTTSPQSLTTGFFNFIFTRAEVKNIHRRFKMTSSDHLSGSRDQDQQDPRYLSEIDIEVFPLDVFISTDCIDMLSQVLLPFIEPATKPSLKNEENESKRTSSRDSLAQLNNNTLPLMYVKAKSSRLYILNKTQENTPNSQPDVFIIELESCNVTSQVDNPISRIIVDQRLYYKSAEAGSLELPGSNIEDRQYQVSLNNFSIYTALWKEISEEQHKPEKILLRTMSENPALEWNSLDKTHDSVKSRPKVQPIVTGINSRLNFAPAIVYRKVMDKRIEDRMIGGISLEWNTLSDITLFLSIQQIAAVNSLTSAMTNITASKQPDNPVPSQDKELLQQSQVPVEVLVTSRSFKLVLYSEQNLENGESAQRYFVEVSIDQPHLFCSISSGVQEVSLSLYTLHIAIPPKNLKTEDIPKLSMDKVFTNVLLDCGNGEPDPISGIRPPLLSIKASSIFSVNPAVKVVLGREVRINLNLRVKDQLDEIMLALQPQNSTGDSAANINDDTAVAKPNQISFESCNVDVTSRPMKVKYENDVDSIGFSVGAIALNSIITKETDGKVKIKSDFSLDECISWLESRNKRYRLISPVCFAFNFAFYFVNPNYVPVKGFARSNVGRMVIHLGPQHIHVINRIIESTQTLVNSNTKTVEGNVSPENKTNQPEDGEHFNDDLRLGTFTISDEKDKNLPSPYKVVYNSSSITWTYPRPRTLTKLMILPLPLTSSVSALPAGTEPTVDCQLQFWSVHRLSWIHYATFQLDESNVVHVDLPLYTDKRKCEFACTWRIEMVAAGNSSILPEVPCSLLSAIRVDSFYSLFHQPQYQFIFDADQIQLCLYNQFCPDTNYKLPENLAGLHLKLNPPFQQNFLSASLDKISSEISVWNFQEVGSTVKLVAKTRVGVNITDYLFLGDHRIMSTGEICTRIQNEGKFVDIFATVPNCDLNIGPFGLHTLRQSNSLWSDSLNGQPEKFVPITQMLVVNETNIHMHVGQSGTDQCIQVGPRTVIMYAWRSQHARTLLRISNNINPMQWSETFSADASSTLIKLHDGTTVIVSVKKISSTLRTITLQGLLTVTNLLKDHLEVKLNQVSTDQICGGLERPVNFLTNAEQPLEIRARLLGQSNEWSNVINLSESPQPFLLRLEMKGKEFLPAWIHVTVENLTSSCSRILAVFAPMYVIQSRVPGSLIASIQTKTKTEDIKLTGFNTSTQINILQQQGSALDHNFDLSFKLTEDGPSSAPCVPVSWKVVQEIRSLDERDLTMEETVTEMKELIEHKLYSDPYSHLSDFKVMPSTTDCKVNFEAIHTVTNTLMIQIQPKLLLVNHLNIKLTLHNGEDSFVLDPLSLMNAQLSNKIRIGAVLPKESQYLGQTLEILDHDWTYVSLLPSKNEACQLSLSGSVVYRIDCGSTACVILVTSEGNENSTTRFIHFKPYFILDDLLGLLHIKARTGIIRRKNLVIQYDNEDKDENYETVSIESGSTMNQILMWKHLDKGDGSPEYIISFSTDLWPTGLTESAKWSRNLAVKPDEKSTRQCFILRGRCAETGLVTVSPCILLTYMTDNQVHIIITKDDRPQMRLVNRLNRSIRYREPSTDNEYVIDAASCSWHTSMYLQQSFPYVTEKRDKSVLQFRTSDNGNWSEPANLGYSQECFLTIPDIGDIKLNVLTGLPTIQVVLQPASSKEISAKDIRERFNSLTLDENNIISEKDSKLDKRSRELSPEMSLALAEEDSPYIFTISLNIQQTNIGVTDDLCNFTNIQEVLRITLFDLKLDILPELNQFQNPMQRICSSQLYEARMSLDNIQLDNQMYGIGLYRFPVVLVKHESSQAKFFDINFKLSRFENSTFVDSLDLGLGKFCVYLEDTLLYVLQDIGKQYVNIGSTDPIHSFSKLPFDVQVQVDSNRSIFYLERIRVRDISVQVTVNASVKIHLGLEDTLLNLARYEAHQLWCTSFSLGHAISRHYLSGALFKAGWVLGSLDVIGNPAAFTRSVQEGIKDFVALPFEGILRGPWGFLVGLTQGSSSLVRHVSAGTITSITNFAQSVSRNLDKLSQDPEHWTRNEEARKLKPRGVSEGIIFGLSSVGVGLLGAFGGLAHHPLQVLLTEGVSPAKLVASVGKGLIGMVAKPLGGAAEFIALTGQGLLVSSGWTRERQHVRSAIPNLVVDIKSSVLKYDWNFSGADDLVLFACDASLYIEDTRQYLPVTCLVTKSKLILVNEYEDTIHQVHAIEEVMIETSKEDPTLIIVLVLREGEWDEDKLTQAKDRVAQFVLDSIRFTENQSKKGESSRDVHEDSLVPVHRPNSLPRLQIKAEYMLYMNHKYMDWFSIMVKCAKQA